MKLEIDPLFLNIIKYGPKSFINEFIIRIIYKLPQLYIIPMYKKNILVILIILVLLVLFFVATRDYEKFKLLERNQITGLDKQTKAIVYTTRFCNQFDEIYRNSCYSGIGLAIGYNNVENFSKCKPLNESIKSICYYHMGRFLGEKYDDLPWIIQKCSEAESEVYKETCETRAIEELMKKYAKNITRAEEFCEVFRGKNLGRKKNMLRNVIMD